MLWYFVGIGGAVLVVFVEGFLGVGLRIGMRLRVGDWVGIVVLRDMSRAE